MKKRKKALSNLLAGVVLLCLLTACGNSMETYSDSEMNQVTSGSQEYSDDGNMEDGYEAEEKSAMPEDGVGTSSSNGNSENSKGGDEIQVSGTENQSQKLIKTVTICAETKEYDKLMTSLTDKVKQLKGYLEESEESQYGAGNRRYCSLTVRVPCESLDTFLMEISESTNVLSKNVSTEDVTLAYVDMESHIKALRTEEETLLRLLEKAEKLSDVITLQNELTDVRYQIESYESQLRTYDNQVRYSTVHLTLEEVERERTVQEKKSFLQEIRSGLSDNLYEIGQVLRSVAIWFIVSLPYFALVGVIVAVIVFVIRIILKSIRKNQK